MSVFRKTSFRLGKRDKTHRPPPLQEMPERQENEAASPRESLDAPGSNHLAVPDTARSNFFTLSSGMSSRSSLFTRNSTSTQDDKHSSFFKLPNLSRGSFVLKREREERKWNPFGSPVDTTVSFSRISRDMKERAFVPKSKRRESASASMSNLLAGLDVIDISATSPNSNVRQRSRTFSTKSASDKPDLPLGVLTGLPPLNIPSMPGRSSHDTSSIESRMPPPPRLDMFGSKVSLVQLPSLSELSPTIGPLSPELDEMPTSPDEPTIVVKMGLHSPSPTIVSATTISTIQDSLLSSYDASSSESEPDQSFAQRDDCVPIDLVDSSVGDDSVFEFYQQVTNSPIDRTPPRLTLTPSAPTSPSKSPRRSGPIYFTFPGPPALPDVSQTPFKDPLEYFSPENMPEESPSHVSGQSSSEPSTSQPKSSLDVPRTPVRQLAANAFKAGNTPPNRKLRVRKKGDSVTTVDNLNINVDESNASLTLPLDECPLTPSTPSFLVGLAWPRPPLRQIYVDTQKPSASWHAVSRTTDERLIDGTGTVNTDPCHVIMLARAGTGTRPGIAETFGLPGVGSGKRRSGLAMHDQQPLSTAAVSALAAFAVRTRTPLSP